MRRRFVGGPLGRSDKEEDGDRGAFSTDYEYFCCMCKVDNLTDLDRLS
jgi:hypothetical protein